jgi:predicted ferric reductase
LVVLMRGDIGASLLINPFGLLLALALVIVPLWIVVDALRMRDSLLQSYLAVERSFAQHKWISFPAIALVLVNWIVNIMKGL